MLFGPVFSAEIVTGARRTRHLLTRLVYGGILLVALVMVYSQFRSPWSAPPGTVQHYADAAYQFFTTYSILQLIGVMLVAPALTAGTIAAERERRTIEYLFASDLSNWEIVIGKLAAALLRSISLLLVGPPILALAMWMGGVGPDRLLVVFVITLSTLVAVTSLALSVSVWSPRARQAFGRVFMYLAMLVVVPPFVYGVLSGVPISVWPSWLQYTMTWLYAINGQLVAANPFWVLVNTLHSTTGTVSALGTYLWPMLGYHALLSAMCIGTSLYAVRRVHLRTTSRGARAPKAAALRPVPERAAMLWKEFYTERSANKLGVVGKLLLAVLILGFIGLTAWMYYETLLGYSGDRSFVQYSMTICTIISCAAVLFAGVRGAATITSERERDTLVTLLSTPLEGREIVLAKWAAALYSLRWLLVALLSLWGLATLRYPQSFTAFPAMGFSTLVLVAFAAMLGVCFSLWCKSSTRALAATLSTLIFLGGGYLFFGFCVLGVLGALGPGGNREFYILGMAPCMLYLLISPVALPDLLRETAHWDSAAVFGVFAYLLGIAGYLLLTAALAQWAIVDFDRLAGRAAAIFGFVPGTLELPPVMSSPQESAAAPSASPSVPASQAGKSA